MTYLHRQDGQLHLEAQPLGQVAEQFGTPAFVYSKAAISAAYQRLEGAFKGQPHWICYAVKANSNLAVLALLARLGAGFDLVSGGELRRVLLAGGDPGKVVFSGVGKEPWEIKAALEAGIACFNMESPSELVLINRIAGEMGVVAPVSVRVNPDVDASTHPYIATGLKESKFGIAWSDALSIYEQAASLPSVKVVGIGCHIGSQITQPAPYLAALSRLLTLVAELEQRGLSLSYIDIGGGMAVRYKDEQPFALDAFADQVKGAMSGRKERLILEPGRSLVAEAGLLLTRVNTLKQNEGHHFAVVDAAMNDLLRPALYQAWQEVAPVMERPGAPTLYDLVGPVCESGDFLAKGRPLTLAEGDLLAILSTGAYGLVMSSNYNTRCRAPEILVDGASCHLIRRRETLEDLLALEALPP